MPRVYIIDDTAPNAFATGRDPQHASVAVTTGLLEKLDREELQGVHRPRAVARPQPRHPVRAAGRGAGRQHRAARRHVPALHVLGRRVRAVATATSSGGGAQADHHDRLALVLAILAPIFARMVQLAVSRQREYLADASSVELTRNPYGLERALAKIASDTEVAGGRQPRHPAPVHRQPDQEARGAARGPVLDPSAHRRSHQPAARADRPAAARRRAACRSLGRPRLTATRLR